MAVIAVLSPGTWTRSTRDIQSLDIQSTLYEVWNPQTYSISIPSTTVYFTFDKWVKGDTFDPEESESPTGPTWNTPLQTLLEGADINQPLSVGGISLAPAYKYVVTAYYSQYAQYDLYINNGEPVFSNIDLTPVETWAFYISGGVSEPSLSRDCHHMVGDATFSYVSSPYVTSGGGSGGGAG